MWCCNTPLCNAADKVVDPLRTMLPSPPQDSKANAADGLMLHGGRARLRVVIGAMCVVGLLL